jgi:hypothetical protein
MKNNNISEQQEAYYNQHIEFKEDKNIVVKGVLPTKLGKFTVTYDSFLMSRKDFLARHNFDFDDYVDHIFERIADNNETLEMLPEDSEDYKDILLETNELYYSVEVYHNEQNAALNASESTVEFSDTSSECDDRITLLVSEANATQLAQQNFYLKNL